MMDKMISNLKHDTVGCLKSIIAIAELTEGAGSTLDPKMMINKIKDECKSKIDNISNQFEDIKKEISESKTDQ